MISCARTITTKVPIGPATSRCSWADGARPNSRGCRPTTSWIVTRTWHRRSRAKCRRRRLSPGAPGCRIMNYVSTAVNTRGLVLQGGLQWYRCRTQGFGNAELQVFSGRSIDVPSLFIAGAQDWGIYQTPGAIERMQSTACSEMTRMPPAERGGTLGPARKSRRRAVGFVAFSKRLMPVATEADPCATVMAGRLLQASRP